MRRVLNGIGGGVVAAAVVVMVAAQAQAQPQEKEWFAPKLIKAVTRLVVRTLGDSLIIPRP